MPSTVGPWGDWQKNKLLTGWLASVGRRSLWDTDERGNLLLSRDSFLATLSPVVPLAPRSVVFASAALGNGN